MSTMQQFVTPEGVAACTFTHLCVQADKVAKQVAQHISRGEPSQV